MNRFVIEKTPKECAQSHCDKHAVKMPLEEAQMLSTAHRMLDGTLEKRPSISGKTMVKYWKLPDDREDVIYKAVHMGHPCTVWAAESVANYRWAYALFEELCEEYSYRYGKVHKCYEKLSETLKLAPDNISKKLDLTPMPLAMGAAPECMNPDDVIGSYRKFYMTKQHRFSMTWKNRTTPEWFEYV
jgi:hypothetical protein